MYELVMDAQSKRSFNALQNSALLIKMWEQGINSGFIDLGRALVIKGRDSMMHDAKTGVIYKVPKRLQARVGKTWHQASAPGESPANYTGDLQKGLHFVSHYTQLEWGYASDTEYGAFLESGTRKMRKRPMLERVSTELAGVAENYISNEVQRNLNQRFA